MTLERLRQGLPWAGLAASVVAVLPPYTRDLDTEMRVEVADHVIPAILVLAVSMAMLARAGRPASTTGSFPLIAGLSVVLAGLWMTSTHVPLVNQARRGDIGVSGLDAAWHTVPGLVVLLLGIVWAAAWWSPVPSEPVP